MKKTTAVSCFMLLIMLINVSAPLLTADAIGILSPQYLQQPTSLVQPFGVLFAAGSGTSEDPFIITQKIQLKGLAEYPDAAFRLDADLHFDEEDFEPGGQFHRTDTSAPRFPIFNGTLDGGGHIISGYRLDIYFNSDKEAYYTTMIGDNHGTIKNVIFSNPIYDSADFGDLSDQVNFTCLAVNNHGNIENCSINALVALDFAESNTHIVSYGGFAINNYGNIENCAAGANVLISARTAKIGGIAAENFGKIKGCYNTGDFISVIYYISIGGITAYNKEDGVVDSCYNNGYLHSAINPQIGHLDIKIGGIAAENSTSDNVIKNCFNTGTLHTIIESLTNYGGINEMVLIGGIVGRNRFNASISSSYNSGSVSTFNFNNTFSPDVGGIAGFNNGKISAVAIDYGLPAVPTTSNADNAVLRSVEEMKTADAYDGFDFTSVFTFQPSGSDFSLPVLKNIPFDFAKSIAGITITNKPNVLRYTDKSLNSDPLNPETLKQEGIEIRSRYNNTDIDDETIDNFNVMYSHLWYGTNTVFIVAEIDGFIYFDSYTIEITPALLSSIEVDPLPVKTDYFLDIDENFDISGATLRLNYADGDSRTIPLTLEFLVDDIAQMLTAAALAKPVYIDFYGYTTAFHINIYNTVIESDTYTLYESTNENFDAYIKVSPGTTVDTLLSGIHQKDYVEVTIDSEPISGDTVLSTGCELALTYNGEILQTIGVAVAGDLNNNGAVNVTDLVLLRSYILGMSQIG